MNPTTWSGVRERVLALREAPNAAQVFGARGHRFELLPPLSEVEVAEAEQEFGVGLPADYRSFLLEVGAGGAGPHYGLYPLQRDERGWAWNEGRGYAVTTLCCPSRSPPLQNKPACARRTTLANRSRALSPTSPRSAWRSVPGTTSGRRSARR